MKKSKMTAILMVVIGLALIVLAACGSNNTDANNDETNTNANNNNDTNTETDTVTEEPEPDMPALVGDSLRGGLMYDKWWKVVGVEVPEGDHPLWATQDNNTRSGGDTWRCKECHGWDYKGVEGAYGGGSHMTGFMGVIQLADGDPYDVLAAMNGETNPDHDFSAFMDDQALTDLALFISEEIIDYDGLVGEDKASLSTDAESGGQFYSGVCASCHGPEGLAIDFKANVTKSEYIGGLASGNPWEFLHKARFGQPGVSNMPPVLDIGLDEDGQAALLAFAQSLPTENATTQGGLLYDKWWNAMGVDAPEGDMPLWATQDTNTRSGTDTWRCKECHGWDYLGVDGAYGDSSHTTGFTGVYGAKDMSAEELTAWLDGSTNPEHDFSAYFDEAVIAKMVSFLQNGLVDMTVMINDDKVVNGDPAAGEGLYNQGCARCHGDDGTAINFKDDDNPVYLGDLSWDNPWESLHKAANGQPGENMPSGINLGFSWEDLANLLAYIQTLGE